MFENLSQRLSGVFDRLTKQGALSEDDVRTAMREVRVALLEAMSRSRLPANSSRRSRKKPPARLSRNPSPPANRSSRSFMTSWSMC